MPYLEVERRICSILEITTWHELRVVKEKGTKYGNFSLRNKMFDMKMTTVKQQTVNFEKERRRKGCVQLSRVVWSITERTRASKNLKMGKLRLKNNWKLVWLS